MNTNVGFIVKNLATKKERSFSDLKSAVNHSKFLTKLGFNSEIYSEFITHRGIERIKVQV